ncbi:electron transfer flavoprotein subunit alpha/FixB family protein [Allobaculum sp. JKK-2023]|uniref:electron transfer flavoprotein subunit alpha/FixB family protein n=1 Tax=Allobaculum sp. JKK-2023 TaxID=3108943 RepID=UPI002B05CE05|nr:electron transfer flavoprotein subunit alpha/FixB family protein [Allobaculum sp. JKK-2023]
MATFPDYKDIYVFVEQKNSEPAEVGYELINKARELVDAAPELGYKVVGVLLGENVKDKAQDVIAHGADEVIVIDDPKLKDYSTQYYTDALTQMIEKFKPSSLLTGATVLGRDLAPRVAARINAGLTADATGIEIGKDVKLNSREGVREIPNDDALLLVTRPTFGGNLFGTIVCPNTRPQMATIRPKVFDMAKPDASRTGEVIEFAPVWDDKAPEVVVEGVEPKEVAGVDITKCDVLVGAGRGAEGALDLVEELASLLGGEVAATRAAVEDGFLPKERQVGQTGKTVRPNLYIACGISGAVQHVAGMEKSDYIIAINRDPEAEIFKIANQGYVGTVEQVLPVLIEEIKKIKAA